MLSLFKQVASTSLSIHVVLKLMTVSGDGISFMRSFRRSFMSSYTMVPARIPPKHEFASSIRSVR